MSHKTEQLTLIKLYMIKSVKACQKAKTQFKTARSSQSI